MTIAETIEYLKGNLHQRGIKLCNGADNRLIDQFEKSLNFKLPEEIKEFYKFSNGFESEDYMFNIISLEDVIENFLKDNQLHIAEYMIYGDLWDLEIDPMTNNIYTIFNIDNFGEKVVLTNSLGEFLERFVEDGVRGLYEWGDDLKKKLNPKLITSTTDK